MIEKGTIRKMGQYYRHNPEYKEEILRGWQKLLIIMRWLALTPRR